MLTFKILLSTWKFFQLCNEYKKKDLGLFRSNFGDISECIEKVADDFFQILFIKKFKLLTGLMGIIEN